MTAASRTGRTGERRKGRRYCPTTSSTCSCEGLPPSDQQSCRWTISTLEKCHFEKTKEKVFEFDSLLSQQPSDVLFVGGVGLQRAFAVEGESFHPRVFGEGQKGQIRSGIAAFSSLFPDNRADLQ